MHNKCKLSEATVQQTVRLHEYLSVLKQQTGHSSWRDQDNNNNILGANSLTHSLTRSLVHCLSQSIILRAVPSASPHSCYFSPLLVTKLQKQCSNKIRWFLCSTLSWLGLPTSSLLPSSSPIFYTGTQRTSLCASPDKYSGIVAWPGQ